ncbi:DUF4271 domain-containing protein [Mucilaginibacter sp.]|uniref:DUF4271 domain-containing protein n=1 Tax=Mucilaginibacter sp. TaxID=1882438 RepID=UPI003D0FABCC
MRFVALCFLLVLIGCATAFAQQDSTAVSSSRVIQPGIKPVSTVAVDSVEIAKESREQFQADSIAMGYLIPDSLRENQFMTQVFKNNIAKINFFINKPLKQRYVAKGQLRNYRDPWLIFVILCLFVYTALLNLFLGNDVRSVIQSFYNKNALSQTDKEGGLINSWAFIGLFVLFCFTLGIVLYQLTIYYKVDYNIGGFQLFISLSVIIAMLFALKFLMLKFLGFVFDINRMVSEYISILNLTYFNMAFVLLAVAACLSLIAARFVPLLLAFTVIATVVIFTWQYLRNSVNVISNIRFHKFYLFVYLCALEICPVLILIKALNI